jgi:hypothetical protein
LQRAWLPPNRYEDARGMQAPLTGPAHPPRPNLRTVYPSGRGRAFWATIEPGSRSGWRSCEP